MNTFNSIPSPLTSTRSLDSTGSQQKTSRDTSPRKFPDFVTLDHISSDEDSLRLAEKIVSQIPIVLDAAEKALIEMQIYYSLLLKDRNWKILSSCAKASIHPSVYFCPRKDFDVETERVCHMQISKDGSVFLIPTKPSIKLGIGQFKKVVLAIDPNRIEFFALRSMSMPTKEMENEIALLHWLGISCLFAWHNGKGKTIVPLAERGSLNDRRIPSQQALYYARQTISLVRDCHVKGVVIRDLKPANLLLTREYKLVFQDLNFSGILGDEEFETQFRGTPIWMSPEVLEGRWNLVEGKKIRDEHIGFETDIFSLGIILRDFCLGINRWVHRGAMILPWLPDRIHSEWCLDRDTGQRAKDIYRDLYTQYMLEAPASEQVLRFPKSKDNFRPRSFNGLFAWMTHFDPMERPDIDEVMEAWAALESAITEKTTKDNAGLWMLANTLVKLMKDSALALKNGPPSKSDWSEIAAQVYNTLLFYFKNMEFLSPGYFSPKEFGFAKKQSYPICHIQVEKDGEVYFIPKLPALFIDKSMLRKITVAVDPNRFRVMAHRSIRREENEMRLEQSFLKEMGMETHFTLSCMKGKSIVPIAEKGKLSKLKLSQNEVREYARKLILLVQNFHRKKVVIQNLTLDNVFVTTNRELQIQDLHFAGQRGSFSNDIYSLAVALCDLYMASKHTKEFKKLIQWMTSTKPNIDRVIEMWDCLESENLLP